MSQPPLFMRGSNAKLSGKRRPARDQRMTRTARIRLHHPAALYNSGVDSTESAVYTEYAAPGAQTQFFWETLL